MPGPRVRLAWRSWLGESIRIARANYLALLALVWPWYGAAAVVLAQAWLLFGLSPFGPRAAGEFWWPALLQELLIGLSGAAVAVRMTRHIALGEPLVVPLREYGRLVFRYAMRFALALVATVAITAAATLILGGIAGIKALLLPAGILWLIKQAVLIGSLVLIFAFVSGRLHAWLTAAALDRDDLDLKASWSAGRNSKVAMTAGTLLLYIPPLAFDLAMLRLVPREASLFLTLPVFLVETVVSLLFIAALAAYFARLIPALAPATAQATAAPLAAPATAISGAGAG